MQGHSRILATIWNRNRAEEDQQHVAVLCRATHEAHRFEFKDLRAYLLCPLAANICKVSGSKRKYSDLRVGYLGASTGAGAALMAAAELPGVVSTVVSRGGRPDLAKDALDAVRAPTLLIVGGDDKPVISMNREALAKLNCPDKKLVIIPGATHLFEEPGTLEEVARVAAEWFSRHFKSAQKPQVQSARVAKRLGLA